jgi:hypothetical protein
MYLQDWSQTARKFNLGLIKHSHLTGRSERENFQWSEVVRGLTDLSTWLSASAYFGILAGLYSFGLFVSRRLPF